MDENNTPQTKDLQANTAQHISVTTWLRTPVTLTGERWMLVAAGVAALILLLVALD